MSHRFFSSIEFFLMMSIVFRVIQLFHFILISATYKKIGDRAFTMQIVGTSNDRNQGADSDEESVYDVLRNLHMTDVNYEYESSIYSTSSDGSSHRLTPVPDDANSKCLLNCSISFLTLLLEHFD